MVNITISLNFDISKLLVVIKVKILRPDYSVPTMYVSIFPYQEQVNKADFLNYKFPSGDTLF